MRSTLFKACLLALVVFGSPAFNWTADAASVGLNGYTNDFSVVPAPADWSGVSVGSSSGTISTSAGLDAAVQALSASGVTSPLASDPLDPPGAGGTPQWSSTGFYVQTRPTGVDASFLMCTLINNIGGNASGVTILYDFKTALPVVEEVLGHRAFYSLTGAAGSWVNIPAFSSASDGRLTATITLNWPNGGTLYLLWADDNGSGTPDTACQIDNFSAKAISAVGMPVAISSQP